MKPTKGQRQLLQLRYLAAYLLLALIATGCNDNGADSDPADSRLLNLVTEGPIADISGPVEGGLHGFPWNDPPFDLSVHGYTQEEYFIEGEADAGGTALPYKTRLLVRKPADMSRFNGTVILEWFNVTATFDVDVIWQNTWQLLAREGYIWVGISAQQMGVNLGPQSLVLWDPLRYGSLMLLNDDYSFDLFTQAARALYSDAGISALGGSPPQRIIAAGFSQSGSRLTTYVNEFQAQEQLFDGFFIGGWGTGIEESAPVPVMNLLTETELGGFVGRSVFGTVPQPDSANIIRWEVAGSAHFDQYGLNYSVPMITKALLFDLLPPITLRNVCVRPVNSLSFHYAAKAALHHLNAWVVGDRRPPPADRIMASDFSIQRDADGNATGGLRLPQIELPVAEYNGDTCLFFGYTRAFGAAELRRRYPDYQAYLDAYDAATDQAVDAGYVLADDAGAVKAEARLRAPWN